MITKQDALTENEFHHAQESQARGQECFRVRRNGRTQTWKTRPEEFRIPVVHGLRAYGQIWHLDVNDWHVASRCPRCIERAERAEHG